MSHVTVTLTLAFSSPSLLVTVSCNKISDEAPSGRKALIGFTVGGHRASQRKPGAAAKAAASAVRKQGKNAAAPFCFSFQPSPGPLWNVVIHTQGQPSCFK